MIPTFHEPARDIPVAKEVDVLVVGAGPAGIGAAVRAAREGAQTLLVESQGMLGGTWTSSMQVHATCFFSGGRVIVGGLVREIIGRLARDGHAEDPERKIQEYPTSSAVHFEPEWMKGCLDDVVVESGAELLLHAFCAGAIVDAGGVGGIVIESKSGRQAIRAAVTIDCTGDADVAHAAGVPTRRGRESDGQCQPVNTTCLLSQVDRERSVAWVEANRGLLRKLSDQAHAAGELDRCFTIGRLGARTCYPDVTYHNIGHVFDIDCTRAEDLTRAELEGRRQVRQIYQFFRKYVPGYERCRLAAVAPTGHFRGHTLDFVDFDEKNARYSSFEERRTRSRNVISRSGRVRQAVRSFRRAFDSLERRGSRRSGSRECTSGARLREAGRLHPPMRLRTVCHPVSAARPGAAGAASPCRPLSASGPCRAPRPCSGRSAAPCPSRATRAP